MRDAHVLRLVDDDEVVRSTGALKKELGEPREHPVLGQQLLLREPLATCSKIAHRIARCSSGSPVFRPSRRTSR